MASMTSEAFAVSGLPDITGEGQWISARLILSSDRGSPGVHLAKSQSNPKSVARVDRCLLSPIKTHVLRRLSSLKSALSAISGPMPAGSPGVIMIGVMAKWFCTCVLLFYAIVNGCRTTET